MRYLDYRRLSSITNSVSPYRGSLNRYPVGNRKENRKYFLVGEEDEQKVFNIVYGSRHVRKYVSKDEYITLSAQGRAVGVETGEDAKYFLWEVAPNIIGVVRPDNSFEFSADGYGQGDNQILSSYSKGYFNYDSRRNGLLYCEGTGVVKYHDGDYVIPIYRGLRVNCETMRPLEPIKVIGKSVDRKASKKLLAKYDDFYKISEVMCKAMDVDTFVSTCLSVLEDHGYPMPTIHGYGRENTFSQRLALAESLISTAPTDAMFLYVYTFDAGRMHYCIGSGGKYGKPESLIEVFDAMKRRLNKHLYKTNLSIFRDVEYEPGKRMPASEWGYTLFVNDKEVTQYGA